MSDSAAETALLQTLLNQIHENIQALSGFLTGKPAALHTFSSLPESVGESPLFEQGLQSEDEASSANRRTIFLLSRIHRTILQLGEAFGAAVDSQQPAMAGGT
jgi:hypothetical protein